jgi:lipoate-protein ligase A
LKFSGNAFCFRKGRAMHHGTLLLNTDLDRLNRYLGSMYDGIETHAIASVPAIVGNLGLPIDELSSSLRERFLHHYRDAAATVEWGVDNMDTQKLDDLYAKQRSAAWKYGATPRFELDIGTTRLEVSRDVVVRAEGPLRGAVEGKSFSDVAFSLRCSVD